MRQYLFILFFLGTPFLAEAQPFGYTYGRTITIDASEIPGSGSLTDFPVLISITSPNFRQVGSGNGRIATANANDVVFYSSDCLQKLDHQMERYTTTGGSGTYVAWVKLPTLSATTNTEIHVYYGNASATNSSSANVWDSNYLGVWHLSANHFLGTFDDATANGNDLNNNGTDNENPGKIGLARELVTGNDDFLELPNNFLSGVTNFSFEGWVWLDQTATNWERIFDFGSSTNINFFFTPSTGANSPAETRARISITGNGGEQGTDVANTNPITGQWIHWAVILDAGSDQMRVYKNGNQYGTTENNVTLTPSSLGFTDDNYFGRSQYAADDYFDGRFDEFRISTEPRSAQWIQTSYNNQDDPMDFYSVGTEQAATALCAPLPITLSVFNAIPDNDNIKLIWSTTTETNNNYFTIERSHDGRTFELVDTVKGAGNSNVKKDYSLIDTNPFGGKSYYRLTQTDYDGTTKSFPLVAVELARGDFSFNIYPNPTKGEFYLELSNVEDNQLVSVSVSDLQGKQIIPEKSIEPGMKVKSSIPLSSQHLLPGVYLVKIKHGKQAFIRKLVVE